MNPNSALSAWQLAIMAIVPVAALAAWLTAIFRAARDPRGRAGSIAASPTVTSEVEPARPADGEIAA
jgi:hypothetical protein